MPYIFNHFGTLPSWKASSFFPRSEVKNLMGEENAFALCVFVNTRCTLEHYFYRWDIGWFVLVCLFFCQRSSTRWRESSLRSRRRKREKRRSMPKCLPKHFTQWCNVLLFWSTSQYLKSSVWAGKKHKRKAVEFVFTCFTSDTISYCMYCYKGKTCCSKTSVHR